MPNGAGVPSTGFCTNYDYNKNFNDKHIPIDFISESIFAVFQNYFSSSYNEDNFHYIFRNLSFYYMLKAFHQKCDFKSRFFKELIQNFFDEKFDYSDFIYGEFYRTPFLLEYKYCYEDYLLLLRELEKNPNFWTNLSKSKISLSPIDKYSSFSVSHLMYTEKSFKSIIKKIHIPTKK